MPALVVRLLARLIEAIGWPFLGLMLAARLGSGRRSWQLEFVDTFVPYFTAPWPLLGALAAWLRSPRLGLLTACWGGLFALCAVELVARGRCPRPGAGPRLRVLTANALGGNRAAKELAELVARERPDLLAVQEVRPIYGQELAALLAPLLPYYRVESHARFAGAALFSRWPIDDLEHFRLARRGHSCLRGRVSVGGRPLHVFNIHLLTPFEVHSRRGGFPPFGIRYRTHARDDEIEQLVKLLTQLDGPVVAMGDYNSAAGTRPHRLLTRHLVDAYREVGRGLGNTFPRRVSIHGLLVPFPLIRIDHVFLRGPIRPLTARTLDHPSSDHRAVLVDLELLEP